MSSSEKIGVSSNSVPPPSSAPLPPSGKNSSKDCPGSSYAPTDAVPSTILTEATNRDKEKPPNSLREKTQGLRPLTAKRVPPRPGGTASLKTAGNEITPLRRRERT